MVASGYEFYLLVQKLSLRTQDKIRPEKKHVTYFLKFWQKWITEHKVNEKVKGYDHEQSGIH